MSKKPNKPEDYKTLRALWYKKLKDEGFEDLEQADGNLRTWSVWFSRTNTPEVFQAKQTYFYLATQFLSDYTFENKTERTIWEYHSESVSIRDTVKIMNRLKRSDKTKVSRDQVWQTVRKLKKAMQAMYLPSVKEYDEPC